MARHKSIEHHNCFFWLSPGLGFGGGCYDCSARCGFYFTEREARDKLHDLHMPADGVHRDAAVVMALTHKDFADYLLERPGDAC